MGTFDCHFNILEKSVHLDIDSINWSNYNRAVFELDCHSLVF